MNHLQAKRHTCGAEGGFLGRQEGNIGVLGRVESKERRKGFAKDQQIVAVTLDEQGDDGSLHPRVHEEITSGLERNILITK